MVYIQLPAELRFRHVAMRVVRAVCSPLDLPEEFVDAVASAMGEAFNNAVLHGCLPSAQPAPLSSIELEIGVSPSAVEIRVSDYGAGFCLDDVAPLDLDILEIADLPESGMGLGIIRSLMSDVSYQVGAPNTLYMRKELPPRSVPRALTG